MDHTTTTLEHLADCFLLAAEFARPVPQWIRDQWPAAKAQCEGLTGLGWSEYLAERQASRQATATAKIEVREITLTRAEGLIEECDQPVTVATYPEADAVLRRWARTAPADGSYNKTDFVVVFEDGEQYRGAYLLQRKDTIGADLAAHMRANASFNAGQNRGDYSEEGYRDLLEFAEKYNPGATERWAEFLERYDLGEGPIAEAEAEVLSAYEMGQAAQREGRPRSPVLDPAFVQTLKPQVGSNTEAIREWLHGWDAANLESERCMGHMKLGTEVFRCTLPAYHGDYCKFEEAIA